MKAIISIAVAASLATLAGGAYADAELAKKKNCMACHAVDKKLIGPAYKDVAAKYKADESAVPKLVEHVRKGSVGIWGQIPMPANPQVSEEEAEELQRKMEEGQFTLEDFLKQMRQIRKMGPIGNLIGMMPGMGAMKKMKDVDVDDGELDRVEAIILSMTPHERAVPQIIKGSRRRRIAEGSGTKIQQVNNLVKQFDQMKKLMKHMAGGQMPDQNQLAKMMGQTQRPKIRRR